MASHLPFLVIAVACFVTGFGGFHLFKKPTDPSSEAPVLEEEIRRLGSRAKSSFSSERGAIQIEKLIEELGGINNAEECRRLALELNLDPANRASSTLWSLVLARWSQFDPEGMVEFLADEKQAGRATGMEAIAWEAFAISEPEKAAARLPSLSENSSKALIRGIAFVDPDLALEAASHAPGADALLATVLRSIPNPTEEQLAKMSLPLSLSRYRFFLDRKLMDVVSKRDPDAAHVWLDNLPDGPMREKAEEAFKKSE